VDFVSNLGTIGDTVVTVIGYLASLKLIKAFRWLNPLFYASAAFESIGIFLEVDNLRETLKFGKGLSEKVGFNKNSDRLNLDQYNNGLKYLEENEGKIEGHLYEDKNRLVTQLVKKQDEARELIEKGEVEKGEKLLHSTMKGLEQRVTTKKWSRVLSILASAVSIVALAVLIFTPFGAIAAGLFFTSAAISLGTYFLYERRKNKAFEKTFFQSA
jgi:hypothetical protein